MLKGAEEWNQTGRHPDFAPGLETECETVRGLRHFGPYRKRKMWPAVNRERRGEGRECPRLQTQARQQEHYRPVPQTDRGCPILTLS
jgi:hypothetical protein